MHSRIYILVILLLFASSVLPATEVTMTGTTLVEDSYLDRGSQTSNFGAEDSIKIQNGFGTYTTGIIRCNNLTDSIPAGANIIACSLIAYVRYYGGGTNKQLQTFRVCKTWDEDAMFNSVTHLLWDPPSNNWTNPGASPVTGGCDSCWNEGDGTGNDVIGDTVRATSATFSDTGLIAIPVDTCHANAWLNGTDVNNGVLIWDNGVGNNFNIISLESSEGANDPIYWKFVYELSTGVPDALHSPDGRGALHSPDGRSKLHGD